MSLTPAQRAHILYLDRVEGVSVAFIAAMTGHSRATVTAVLRQTHRPEAPASEADARRPSSKGHIERKFPSVRAALLGMLGKGAR